MKSKKLTIVLFIIYLLVLVWIVLLKTKFSFASLEIRRNINLIPFGDMLILNGRPSYNEIGYNLLAFVPFGIFLCMLSKKRSFVTVFVPILLASLFVELLQFVFAIGASDITDVLANTAGGGAGIGLFFLLQKACKERAYQVINTAALVFAVVLALLIGAVRVLYLRH